MRDPRRFAYLYLPLSYTVLQQRFDSLSHRLDEAVLSEQSYVAGFRHSV